MFTFTGISHHTKPQEGAIYVSVHVLLLLLLLFLLSSKGLEAKLFFLGVDALADPVHALLNPLTSEGRAGLDLPNTISDGVQV